MARHRCTGCDQGVTAGLLDTNVFIHALSWDAQGAECRKLLDDIASGQFRARLEPIVAHELSYVLPRYRKQMTRQDVAEYLTAVLQWEGLEGEKDVLAKAVSI